MAQILITDLTTKSLTGTGVFDTLMSAVVLRLEEEFDQGRITGTDYSKVYLGGMDSVLQQSIAYLLGQQQADKQADLTAAQILQVEQETLKAVEDTLLTQKQVEKVVADISLLTQQEAKLVVDTSVATKQGIKLDADTAYVNEQRLKIAEDSALVTAQRDKIVSDISVNTEQKLKIAADTALTTAQIPKVAVEVDIGTQNLLNLENDRLKSIQETALIAQNAANALLTATTLAKQNDKIDSEIGLLTQKKYTEEAQITDTVNLVAVTGTIGAQKTVYTKQAEGFDRNAELKLAKLYSDIYTVQRSTDDAFVTAGSGLEYTNSKQVLKKAFDGVVKNVAFDDVSGV